LLRFFKPATIEGIMMDSTVEVGESQLADRLPSSIGNIQSMLKYDEQHFQPLNPRGRVFARFDRGMAYGPDILREIEEHARMSMPLPDSRALINEVYDAKYKGIAHEKLAETQNATPESILEQDFLSFYPQLILFGYFGDQENLPELLPSIVEKVNAESERFAKAAFPHNESDQKVMEEHLNGLMHACYQGSERNDRKLAKEAVEMTFQAAMNDPELLYYAFVFDNRNRGTDDYLNIRERVGEMISARLQNPEDIDRLDVFLPFIPHDEMIGLIIETLKKTDTHDSVEKVILTLTPYIGVEQIRKSLREYVNKDESFRSVFNSVFEYMELDPASNLASELSRDVYNEIDLSEYKPNQEVQEFELDLLKKELTGCKDVLDLACGTGRHLMEMDGFDGMHVAGMDITQKHIDYIKEKRPDSDVMVGSWHNIPFDDKALDAVYILGRSFTHNTTIPDAINCLKEIKRVIKDDGVVILDLPDPNKGDYKVNIEKTQQAAKRKGMKKILPGLISDSPDMEHYYDRYAPSAQAFKAIAALAGFDAKKLPVEKGFHGVSGEENVNTYWVLKKSNSIIINPRFFLLDILQPS